MAGLFDLAKRKKERDCGNFKEGRERVKDVGSYRLMCAKKQNAEELKQIREKT